MQWSVLLVSVELDAGRMSYTKLIIFVALALPAVIAADNGNETQAKCIYENENVMKSFQPVSLCFREILQEQIGDNASSEGCHTVEDFNTTFETFRLNVINSCVKEENRKIFMNRKTYLYDFMAFSLNNNTFKDFYKNNGTECVKNNKDDLATCVVRNSGRNVTEMKKSDPAYWLNLNKPIFTNSSCETTKDIKNCVAEIVANKCSAQNSEYIISLFDHLLDFCKTDINSHVIITTTPTTETNKNWASQFSITSPAFIGMMTMFLLI